MNARLLIAIIIPMLTTGCIVYDAETPERLPADTGEVTIRDTGSTVSETHEDDLAWLTPSTALIGSVGIFSLQGDFDYADVTSLSFDGPSLAEIVTTTVREDEILIVIGVDAKGSMIGENSLTINFADGSAFIVPSVLTVTASQPTGG